MQNIRGSLIRTLQTDLSFLRDIDPNQMSSQPVYPISKWGADDTKGALNLMTDGSIAEAFQLIRKNKVFQLGIVVTTDTLAYPPRKYIVNLRNSISVPIETKPEEGKNDYIEDLYNTGACGTHMDTIWHIHCGGFHYNHRKSSDIAAMDGMMPPCDLSDMKPMVARGVVLDMTEYFGQNPVPGGTPYTDEDIKEAAESQGVSITKGTVVLFYSGWLKYAQGPDKDDELFFATEPGLGMSGARYLSELDIMAVGADTVALEVLPSEDKKKVFPVHGELLVKNGIYLFEMVDIAELVGALVKDNVHEFCFISSPPRLTGGVQLLTNPLAIF